MQKIYIVMNKPKDYVCSSVSDSHKTVFSLLPCELQKLLKAKRGERLHTIGRLDCDATGLLLLTTDGYFSSLLARPENHIEKEYEVTLEKEVTKEEQERYIKEFLQGVVLPAEKKAIEQKSSPAKLFFLQPNKCLVTINEGKFHQVKRLFLAVGNKVNSLHRTKIGNFALPKELKMGEFMIIEKSELERFIFT